MTTKQPYIPLNIDLWENQTKSISNLAEIALLKLTFKLFDSPDRGLITINLKAASILFKSDLLITKSILNELSATGLLIVTELESGMLQIISPRLNSKYRISIRPAYVRNRIKAVIFTAKSAVREIVFKLHGETCLCCGATDKICLDHIIAIKNGGENSIENLQPLCKSCNSSKGAKTIDYRKNG